MVTIDELKWFVELAEAEHMTVAAQRLSLTQPALSRALQRLERRFGSPLFDRVNQRIQLNPSGRILLEHARQSLAEIAVAEERISAARDPHRGTIRLAFLPTTSATVIPDILTRFGHVAPDVKFRLTQALGHEIVEHLDANRVDIALTARGEEDDRHWWDLYTERLRLAVPAGHRLADRTAVALEDVGEEVFVTLQEPIGFRRLTDELCARAGIAPQIAFEGTEVSTLENFVDARLGIAVVPPPWARLARSGVRYIPLSDAGAHRRIGLAWPRRGAASPVVARFASWVRTSFASVW